MYLTTPYRYPQMKGIPNSPAIPRNLYPAQSPTMNQFNPFMAPNSYRPQPSCPISSRGAPGIQYHRTSTPQAYPTGKTVPVNSPPFIPGSLPVSFQTGTPAKVASKKGINQPSKPYSQTIPVNLNRPSSAVPVQQNSQQPGETQMIQSLSKENQDLKKQLAKKEQELTKLKAREEMLETKFKELQEKKKQ